MISRGAALAIACMSAAIMARAAAVSAFTPPAIQGHVTDTAGVLTADDRAAIEQHLEAVRLRSGYEIAVFMCGSLNDETIEDVAYTTFNTWHLGQRGHDNGVLLVIAPHERRVRIETGRGVGGAITDLQANDIIRATISPALRENRYRDAVLSGSDAIAQALEHGSAPGTVPQGARDRSGSGGTPWLSLVMLLVFALLAMRARRRGGFMFLPMGGGGWGGGGSSGSY